MIWIKMYKLADFCAGVGGIRMGFKCKDIQCVYSNDIDRYCKTTYDANFEGSLDCKDIHDIDIKKLPDFDIMCAGFPCQPFSQAGQRKGFGDHRSNVFYTLVKIIHQKTPTIVFFENVKGLVGHDKGNTFKVIQECLRKEGYRVYYQVLNTCEYSKLPQNRERIYIICVHKRIKYKFRFPKPVSDRLNVSDLLESQVEDKYVYGPNSGIYDKLVGDVTKDIDTNTVYQYRRHYVRENRSGVCPTLTANMGTGGHNVPIILQDGTIRKLTPRECFNLQGFKNTYVLPRISNGQLYKQAGNSVSVPVVKRLATRIVKLLKK